MSVITAVQPHAIINDSDYVYTTVPGVDNRRPDREHWRAAPAARRSCAWEDQFAEVVHARLPRLAAPGAADLARRGPGGRRGAGGSFQPLEGGTDAARIPKAGSSARSSSGACT